LKAQITARGDPLPSVRPTQKYVTRRLNLSSHIPLYMQLTEILKERIEFGEWQPGNRFASEGEIGAEFAVSRAVVRPAIAILVTDGQLVKLKGRGVFVAPKKVSHRMDGLVRSLLADAGNVRSQILDASEEEVDERLASALDIPASQGTVAHIVSMVEVDDCPIGIRDSYICPLIAPAVMQWLSPVTARPARFALPGQLRLDRSEAEIEVTSASPFEAERLGIKSGSPTILTTYTELAHLPGSRIAPVEFARIVYRADITSFRFAFG
jgi:DNA-binding GntR family transcriptional regulator